MEWPNLKPATVYGHCHLEWLALIRPREDEYQHSTLPPKVAVRIYQWPFSAHEKPAIPPPQNPFRSAYHLFQQATQNTGSGLLLSRSELKVKTSDSRVFSSGLITQPIITIELKLWLSFFPRGWYMPCRPPHSNSKIELHNHS